MSESIEQRLAGLEALVQQQAQEITKLRGELAAIPYYAQKIEDLTGELKSLEARLKPLEEHVRRPPFPW